MTDLRAAVVEAGAEAIKRRYVDPRSHTFEDLAEVVLDAGLDTLADRADEWVDAATKDYTDTAGLTRYPRLPDLIAVLREGR